MKLKIIKEDTVMKKVFLLSLVVSFFVASFMCNAYAAGTAAEAEAMVKKAIAFFKANGKDKAFQEFNKGGSGFKKDDLYVWVSDMKMTVLSHGANDKLIGKELIGLKDSNGKLFMKEIADMAKAKGTGWVDYTWTNPVSKKVEKKSTFFQHSDDLIFACGIYKP
jgi:cytochrome c